MRYARKMGVVLGENCRLIGLPDWGSEPWLISIGNHTEVSFDVAFITHDGATWCFRDQDEYKGTLKFGRIRIGNNCFIGARSTILPGVTIGDNSIVAVGAVVNKSIPSGEVEGTEKVDNTACICYNVNIKYRRCFYDRTTAEISVKSIHGNI